MDDSGRIYYTFKAAQDLPDLGIAAAALQVHQDDQYTHLHTRKTKKQKKMQIDRLWSVNRKKKEVLIEHLI